MGLEEYKSSVNQQASATQKFETLNANGKASGAITDIISWHAMVGWSTMLLGALGAGYAFA